MRVGLDVILMVLGFLVLLVAGVPIAFALLLPSAVHIALSPNLNLFVLANGMATTIQSYPLIAIPLYLLVAEVMTESDAGKDLFDLIDTLTRHFKGGLAQANILVNLIFAGMSGSYTADLVGLGKVQVPEMVKRGFLKEIAVGVNGAAACLGPIFPPSIFMILYGMIVGESIGKLFLGGILPAFLMVICLAVLVRFHPLRATYPKPLPRASSREIARLLPRTIPAVLTPLIILGSIVLGIATTTEAAGIALVYVMLLWSLFYRTMTRKALIGILTRTARFCAAVFIMVSAASVFAWLLTLEQLPTLLPPLIQSITNNATVAMLLVMLFVLVLGCFLDGLAIMLIVTPFLVPLMQAYGMDKVHFGVAFTLAITMGALTPPYGLAIFAMADIAKLGVGQTIRGLAYFLAPLFIALGIVVLVPEIVTALPNFFLD